MKYDLTERQIRILQLLSDGFKHCEVASVCCRSIKTIEMEITNICKTMGVRNTMHAVTTAIVLHIIKGPKIG